MKLLALSDLHVGLQSNRRELEALPAAPDDWLILGGDVGETVEHLEWTLDLLAPRFARLAWVPGNHELWTPRAGHDRLRGLAKYEHLVALCRSRRVLTPEDPFVLLPGDGPPRRLALLFLLYDYSFRPDDVPLSQAVDWAAEANTVCADEIYLHPDPYPTRAAWCAARCDEAERRLAQATAAGERLVIVNHWPMREDLLRLWRIPRFSLRCGTRRTHDWHQRFRADVVVYGHTHMPHTDLVDGVRFEEVSFGYPRERAWRHRQDAAAYVRQVLPPLATAVGR